MHIRLTGAWPVWLNKTASEYIFADIAQRHPLICRESPCGQSISGDVGTILDVLRLLSEHAKGNLAILMT